MVKRRQRDNREEMTGRDDGEETTGKGMDNREERRGNGEEKIGKRQWQIDNGK
jgi:hypothetical protein